MTNEKAISMLHYLAESIDNFYKLNDEGKEVFEMAIEALRRQDQALNEWCTDCKEYDHEKHCCPRFNRVIKSALEDVTVTNVGDTISRQDAIKDAESWVAVDGYERHLQKNVVEWLKEFPPAQPIIRCKDCKKMQYDEVFNVMYCDGKQVSPMHYCGYAKKRGGA